MTEQIYNDFTTKLLPKIAEGLTMTKEYFTDLFGRYIHYLIVTDIIWIVANLICLITFSILAIKTLKWARKLYENDYENPLGFIAVVFIGVFAIVCACGVVDNVMDLVKAVYVPEIRVYEELSGFMSHQ